MIFVKVNVHRFIASIENLKRHTASWVGKSTSIMKGHFSDFLIEHWMTSMNLSNFKLFSERNNWSIPRETVDDIDTFCELYFEN